MTIFFGSENVHLLALNIKRICKEGHIFIRFLKLNTYFPNCTFCQILDQHTDDRYLSASLLYTISCVPEAAAAECCIGYRSVRRPGNPSGGWLIMQ